MARPRLPAPGERHYYPFFGTERSRGEGVFGVAADSGEVGGGGEPGQLGAAGGDGFLEGGPLVDAPVRVVGLAVEVVVDVGAPAAGERVVDVQSELHGRGLPGTGGRGSERQRAAGRRTEVEVLGLTAGGRGRGARPPADLNLTHRRAPACCGRWD